VKKKRVFREKFWSEQCPTNNLDFVEISLPDESVDEFVQKYAKQQAEPLTEREANYLQKRKGRLVRKIFKAASLYFTDRQWQIFIHRWVGAFKEVEIAEKLRVDQSYVSSVLKACHLKLQKVLGMQNKKYLRTKVKSYAKNISKR
jgi:DNA-directed RNA polymerase specialized sigma subunit